MKPGDFIDPAFLPAAAKMLVTLVVPATGQTQAFTSTGTDHIIACDNAATLAAQTFTLPLDANSSVGQVLRIFTSNIITLATLATNGNSVLGLALTTMPVNGSAAWVKVGAAKWARIQQ